MTESGLMIRNYRLDRYFISRRFASGGYKCWKTKVSIEKMEREGERRDSFFDSDKIKLLAWVRIDSGAISGLIIC